MSLLRLSDCEIGFYDDFRNIDTRSHLAKKEVCTTNLDGVDWLVYTGGTLSFMLCVSASNSNFVFIDAVKTSDIPFMDDQDEVLGSGEFHAYIACHKFDGLMIGGVFVSDTLYKVITDSMGVMNPADARLMLKNSILDRRAERLAADKA